MAAHVSQETALIATLATGLGLAFLLGLLATRLRLPPLIGYLLAGVVVGPFTPGLVVDRGLAEQLAEVGVILLMFGVGLHFSVADLLAVRRIAVPGALAQIVAGTALGALLGHAWGWSWGTGLVFGLALSVASTVVLLRALEDHGILDTAVGRIGVGWLVVEDVVTVLVLVLLPALAPLLRTGGGVPLDVGALGATLGLTLLKVVAFVALMLVVGRRLVPWLLERVARTGSRELFTLAVLVVALGIAFGASALFGVSFALGAFLAGVIVSESDFSHEAATNALPLRDAFAVLFFVSVGMLFDPTALARAPLALLGVAAIVLVANPLVAFAVVLVRRHPLRTALVIGTGVSQIGEFSFIIAALGLSLGLLPREAQSLVVAGALLTITLNPFVMRLVEPIERWIRARPRLADALERPLDAGGAPPARPDHTALVDHVVLVGYGRVGEPVVAELAAHGVPHVVVEASRERAAVLRARGLPAIHGDATRPEVLAEARLAEARLLVVAAPDAYQTRAILQLARRMNPMVRVVARTHSDEERGWLEAHGADRALVGERELAVSLTRHALREAGVPHDMEAVAARALALEPPLAPDGAPASAAERAPALAARPGV